MRYHYFAITILLFIAGIVVCAVHGIDSPFIYLGITLSSGAVLYWISYGFFFGYIIPLHPLLYSVKTEERDRLENWFRENNGKALLAAYVIAGILVAPLQITKAVSPYDEPETSTTQSADSATKP